MLVSSETQPAAKIAESLASFKKVIKREDESSDSSDEVKEEQKISESVNEVNHEQKNSESVNEVNEEQNINKCINEEHKEQETDGSPNEQSPSPSNEVGSSLGDKGSSPNLCETHIKPLSHFGTFKIDPKIRELKWIKNNTSGEVHPDIPTISMLFNQDLKFPESAKKFISQTPQLTEEARWEKLKAKFYKSLPLAVQNRAFEVLSKRPALQARRFIVSETLKFKKEFIISPGENLMFTSVALEKLDEAREKKLKDFEEIISAHEKALVKLGDKVDSFLCHDDTFMSDEMKGPTYDRTYERQIIISSSDWTVAVSNYQEEVYAALKTRVAQWQLQNVKMRLDRYTNWIHVKFKVMDREPSALHNSQGKLIPFRKSKFDPKGTVSNMKQAIEFQSNELERVLHEMGRMCFRQFRLFRDTNKWIAYKLRIPYEKVKPKLCISVLGLHMTHKLEEGSYYAFYEPKTLGSRDSFHDILIYIRSNLMRYVLSSNSCIGSTMEKTGDQIPDFCSKCFSEDHFCCLYELGFGGRRLN